MKNSSAQLRESLSKNLLPVYIICGDEILLVEEAFDLVCKEAKSHGFQERITFEPKLNIDWEQLHLETNTLSLFNEKRILVVRIPTGTCVDVGVVHRRCAHANQNFICLRVLDVNVVTQDQLIEPTVADELNSGHDPGDVHGVGLRRRRFGAHGRRRAAAVDTLMGEPSAVDGDDRPGDVVRVMTRQEESGTGDVPRFSPAASGDTAKKRRPYLGIVDGRSGQVGIDVSGGDAVDLDSLGRPLVGQSPDHSCYPGLGYGVGRHAAATEERPQGGREDDLARTPLQHRRREAAGKKERCGQVELDQSIPVVHRVVHRRCPQRVSCVVDQDIDSVSYTHLTLPTNREV